MQSPAAPSWPAEDPATFVDELFAWMTHAGSSRYDEVVTQLDHALQCAFLAERAGDSDEAVAAALLHDVGHLLLGEHRNRDEFLSHDLEHEVHGARWLEAMFPQAVTAPIAAHVDAKRYLCAVDEGYHGRLSPGSVRSLELQGGPLDATEVARWESDPELSAAVALRRRDDGAKVPGREVPGLEHYRELLCGLIVAPPAPA